MDGVGHLPKGSNSADVSSDVSSTATIRQTKGNGQEKSSGRGSAEGVDVDALFSAVSPYINEPVTLSLPVVGDFRLDRSDFEKLYRYLKGEL